MESSEPLEWRGRNFIRMRMLSARGDSGVRRRKPVGAAADAADNDGAGGAGVRPDAAEAKVAAAAAAAAAAADDDDDADAPSSDVTDAAADAASSAFLVLVSSDVSLSPLERSWRGNQKKTR